MITPSWDKYVLLELVFLLLLLTLELGLGLPGVVQKTKP